MNNVTIRSASVNGRSGIIGARRTDKATGNVTELFVMFDDNRADNESDAGWFPVDAVNV